MATLWACGYPSLLKIGIFFATQSRTFLDSLGYDLDLDFLEPVRDFERVLDFFASDPERDRVRDSDDALRRLVELRFT